MFRFIKSLFHPYKPITIQTKQPKTDPWDSVYALIKSLGAGLEAPEEYIDNEQDTEQVDKEDDLNGSLA